MYHYLKLYLVALVSYLSLDMVWLGLVADTFYRKHLGFLMTSTPFWLAAIIFYLLFPFGILVFVVVPGLKETSFKTTLFRAALFGLITYSTYDLTNLATVEGWPMIVTVVDIIWGTVLTVAVSLAAFTVGKRLN